MSRWHINADADDPDALTPWPPVEWDREALCCFSGCVVCELADEAGETVDLGGWVPPF